jgi:hypothetical protein
LTRRSGHAVVLILTVVFASASAREARADFLITPFIGTEFGGKTASPTLLDLDLAAGARHWVFGGSAAWLSDQILGVEADIATVPGFLEQSGQMLSLISGSRVSTLSGNVLIAVPLAVSRDSLRPYALAGLGLIHAATADPVSLNDDHDWPGLQVGGGAIGLITRRAGVRFDLRHTRALSRGVNLRGERSSRLSFWRATVGVTLRY